MNAVHASYNNINWIVISLIISLTTKNIKKNIEFLIWVSLIVDSSLMIWAKFTWRMEKIFSAKYFCWIVAPLCCNLSGWRQSLAFWYAFFTFELSMRLISGTAYHPLWGHRTWTQCQKTLNYPFPYPYHDHIKQMKPKGFLGFLWNMRMTLFKVLHDVVSKVASECWFLYQLTTMLFLHLTAPFPSAVLAKESKGIKQKLFP